jgi:hypothetical protein
MFQSGLDLLLCKFSDRLQRPQVQLPGVNVRIARQSDNFGLGRFTFDHVTTCQVEFGASLGYFDGSGLAKASIAASYDNNLAINAVFF